ncbi:Isoleucine N-monooxygenase [Arachis hypogaea]|nr:Isoleucine N-monooxygenase [Arachis hypogaea]
MLFCIIIPLFNKLLKLNDSTKKSKKPRLPPGPKPWPIVGNIPQMLANKPTLRWIQNIMNDLNTEIACIRLGNVHVIPVTSPSIARQILMKQDAIFASRPLSWSSKFVSSGYLATTLTPFGEQWKKMKRVIVEELISPQRHQWLHDKRVQEADNLVLYVYNQIKNGSGLVDLRHVGQHYGGNLIRRLLFNKRYFGNGREDGGPGAEELEYVEAQFMVVRHIYAFSVSDYLPFLWGFDFEGHKKILKKATNTLRKYHDPIIEERICQWRNGTRTHQEDWLDVLISLKDANNNPFLTLQEIKSQIMEIAVGTMDNPYNNVEWVLSEIINQPEILQKAIEELDKVVGKKRLVQESDIPKLNYVKACLREGFRLHPINDFNIPHVSMKDTIVANYFIPKGSHILIRRQGIGQNPRVWNEPLKFKPERHLKKDGYDLTLTESNLELFIFGTGRRSCPAITLGTTVIVMLFARLVHGFTWIAPPNEPSINLSELEKDTTKVKPLVALGKPRLPLEVYHQIN